MLLKVIYSKIIDFFIVFSVGYFVTIGNKELSEWFNLFERASFIYLLIIISTIFFNIPQTVGETIVKIKLVDVKSTSPSKKFYFLLNFMIAGALYTIPVNFFSLNEIFRFFGILTFIFPIQLEINQIKYFSLFNFLTKTTYIKI